MVRPIVTTTCALAAALISTSALAADPVPFASVSDTCLPGTFSGSKEWTAGPFGEEHPAVIAKITADAPGEFSRYGPGLSTNDIFGPETVWFTGSFGTSAAFKAGETAKGTVECMNDTGPVNFTVEYVDVPTPPTTFAATSRKGSTTENNSEMTFRVASAGPYALDLTLTQGALDLTYPTSTDFGSTRDATTIVASSRTIELGELPKGLHSIKLIARDGPPAQWSLHVRAKPVQILGAKVTPPIASPDKVLEVSYTTTGPTDISAAVYLGRNIVRTLATKNPVESGQHTLTWDGLNAKADPVADGVYTVALLSEDAAGTRSVATPTVTIDGTKPTITPGRAPRSRRSGIFVDVSDNLSGVARASMRYRGKVVAKLGRGGGRMIFRPNGGWKKGLHKLSIRALDRAGNEQNLSYRLRIK